MCIEHRELVQKLALAGIEFSAPLRAPGGAMTVILTAGQACLSRGSQPPCCELLWAE